MRSSTVVPGPGRVRSGFAPVRLVTGIDVVFYCRSAAGAAAWSRRRSCGSPCTTTTARRSGAGRRAWPRRTSTVATGTWACRVRASTISTATTTRRDGGNRRRRRRPTIAGAEAAAGNGPAHCTRPRRGPERPAAGSRASTRRRSRLWPPTAWTWPTCRPCRPCWTTSTSRWSGTPAERSRSCDACAPLGTVSQPSPPPVAFSLLDLSLPPSPPHGRTRVFPVGSTTWFFRFGETDDGLCRPPPPPPRRTSEFGHFSDSIFCSAHPVNPTVVLAVLVSCSCPPIDKRGYFFKSSVDVPDSIRRRTETTRVVIFCKSFRATTHYAIGRSNPSWFSPTFVRNGETHVPDDSLRRRAFNVCDHRQSARRLVSKRRQGTKPKSHRGQYGEAGSEM